MSINKCKVILIYAPCASAIVGSLINLSNNLTAVSAMTSVTMLSSWGKVHPLKPHPPFSVAVTHILLSGKRSDGLFRPTDHTRFLILRFLTARRGVIFADMVGLSLNFQWSSDFYPFLPCHCPSPFHASSKLFIFWMPLFLWRWFHRWP